MSIAQSAGLRVGVIGLRGFPNTYSGLERVSEEIYPALVARGHSITVFCRNPSDSVPRYCLGVRREYAPSWNWHVAETVSHAASAAVRAIRARNYDLVHLRALAPALLSPMFRAAGIPTVLTVDGLDWRRARWRGGASHVLRLAEKLAVRHVDEIIVVSRELKEYFQSRYKRRTRLVFNAVSPGPAPNGQNASGRRMIAYVGRLVPEKRVEDLIGAFRSLDEDAILRIAGTGPPGYVASLTRLAAGDARVEFAGHLDRSTIRNLFTTATAAVFPSELEGLPLSLLECVECGAPAIASDIAPHREILGSSPLLFPVGCRLELGQRLRAVLSAGTRFRAHAELMRNRVSAAFSVEELVQRTERVFRDAVARGGKRI